MSDLLVSNLIDNESEDEGQVCVFRNFKLNYLNFFLNERPANFGL